jgi:hypothetical protein
MLLLTIAIEDIFHWNIQNISTRYANAILFIQFHSHSNIYSTPTISIQTRFACIVPSPFPIFLFFLYFLSLSLSLSLFAIENSIYEIFIHFWAWNVVVIVIIYKALMLLFYQLVFVSCFSLHREEEKRRKKR